MKSIDLSSVTALMENAGKSILSWQNDLKFRKLYSEADYKTEADRQAHDQICSGLSKIHPSIDVVSEESPSHSSDRPHRYWLIDPIDGTASWYGGFTGFVTQAAYLEHGKPIFGIVHAPALAKTWTALNGTGAFINGRRMPILAKSNRLIVTDNTPSPHGISRQIISKMQATGYLESGSLGLKSVLVAEGTADLFVKNVCVRDWDLAPAAVILQEVGGKLSLSDGSPFVFDGPYEKPNGFIVARDQSLLTDTIKTFSLLQNSIAT